MAQMADIPFNTSIAWPVLLARSAVIRLTIARALEANTSSHTGG